VGPVTDRPDKRDRSVTGLGKMDRSGTGPTEWHASLPSTMTVAAQRAREGCPHLYVVGADEQTAGMGRHGRTWHSQACGGLYVSIILRMPPTGVTLALGLATQEAITLITGLAPDLRWPNDVLIGGRKCAGVLAQLEGEAIIAGIGINLSQTEFPEGLATPATSLLLEGAVVQKDVLLAALMQAVERCCKVLAEDGVTPILRAFEASSSYAIGRRVKTDDGVEGVTRGLDASGFLIVREDSGKETAILTGGVRGQ